MAACLVVHAAFMFLVIRSHVAFRGRFPGIRGLPLIMPTILLATVLMAASSMLQILIWFGVLRLFGTFPDVQDALYCSGTTYTTLGTARHFLVSPYRMLEPLEAMTGTLAVWMEHVHEDRHNRRPRCVPARRCVGVQFPDECCKTVSCQAACADGIGRCGVAEQFPGPPGVPGDARGLSLPDLHGRGGEMDQSLDEPGLGTRAAQGVPEALPRFVGLPIETLVEEIQGVAPMGIRSEERGKGVASGRGGGRQGGERRRRDRRLGGRMRAGVKVAGGVVHRVR